MKITYKFYNITLLEYQKKWKGKNALEVFSINKRYYIWMLFFENQFNNFINDLYKVIQIKEQFAKEGKDYKTSKFKDLTKNNIDKLLNKVNFLKRMWWRLKDSNGLSTVLEIIKMTNSPIDQLSSTQTSEPSCNFELETTNQIPTIEEALVLEKNQPGYKKYRIKNSKYSRCSFFRIQKFFMDALIKNIVGDKVNFESFLKDFIPKSKKPISIKKKYTEKQEKQLAANFDYDRVTTGQNVLNFTYYTKQGKYSENATEFAHICAQTIAKILNRYSTTYIKTKARKRKLHKLRSYYSTNLGYMQLDIKHLTPNKFNTKKTLYLIDIKDENCKLYYGLISETANKEDILKLLNESYHYFEEQYGFKINRIRTDHCNIFKKTQSYSFKGFVQTLENLNIRHEFIRFQQPECNGVVERGHRTINNEFYYVLNGETDIVKANQKLQIYINWHNNVRVHSFVRKTKSSSKKYIIHHSIPKNRALMIQGKLEDTFIYKSSN